MDAEPMQKEKIREWVEAHGGHPQLIHNPKLGDDPVLRFQFDQPGEKEDMAQMEAQQDLSWDRFYEVMDEMQLDLILDGEDDESPSDAYHFIKRA